MNRRRVTIVSLATLVLALVVGAFAASGDNPRQARMLHAHALTGLEEVPSISSDGTGTFEARISPDDSSIEYELTYSGLEEAFAAHVHLGQRAHVGGVIFWLCGPDGVAPVNTPECPEEAGTVTGTIEAGDIVGPEDQGLSAGDLEATLEAMRHGATYVNVHTADFGGGEIRGQIGVPQGHQR